MRWASTGDLGLRAAVITGAVLAAFDAVAGQHAIVIGLLAAGPGLAVVDARVRSVLGVGLAATAAVLVLCWFDGIWGTVHAALYLGGVSTVTGVSSVVAYCLGERQRRAAAGAARLQAIFAGAHSGMALVALSGARQGRLEYVNPTLCQIAGYSEERLLTMRAADLFAAGDDIDPAAQRAELLTGGGAYDAVRSWRRGDGPTVWVRLHVRPVCLAGGPGPDHAVVQVDDVTGQRQTQAELVSSEERFRLAFDNAPIGMMLIGLRPGQQGQVLRVNDAACRVFGYDEPQLLGLDVLRLTHPADLAAKKELIRQLAGGECATFQTEKRYLRADGEMIWGLLSASVVRGTDGHPDYYVSQVEDISSRRRAEETLTHLALHDALTGLPNRVLLRDHVEQALARSARTSTRTAVLFLDLDDFKNVNDSLGHDAGDELLVEIADRLRSCLRDTDTAARLGGDEFVVVCEGLTHPDEATQVASRLKQVLGRPCTLRGHDLQPSASIGITLDSPNATADELLRAADSAMYHAKKHGKGRYELSDPLLYARAEQRIRLESELHRALAEDELRLHYQPTIDLLTGAVRGVEALLRWQHPDRGLLMPVDFLDIAEDRALVNPIGDWVLRTACTQASIWQQDLGDAAPTMWVNIASGQLGQQQLTRSVADALTDSGLAPSKLGLELTERQLISSAHSVRADLLALPSLGVHLAIDDFGTGYGSLEYLRRYPVDELKIDMTFIAGLGRDRADTAITASVIALARSLDISTVAEGVETIEQHALLTELECPLAQGYLYHRPAPAADITQLLAV